MGLMVWKHIHIRMGQRSGSRGWRKPGLWQYYAWVCQSGNPIRPRRFHGNNCAFVFQRRACKFQPQSCEVSATSGQSSWIWAPENRRLSGNGALRRGLVVVVAPREGLGSRRGEVSDNVAQRTGDDNAYCRQPRFSVQDSVGRLQRNRKTNVDDDNDDPGRDLYTDTLNIGGVLPIIRFQPQWFRRRVWQTTGDGASQLAADKARGRASKAAPRQF